MRKILREVAVAVAAGTVGFLLTAVLDGLDNAGRVAAAVGVAALAFAAIHFLSSTNEAPPSKSVQVGKSLDSHGSVKVNDVTVSDGSASDVAIGHDVRADKDISITGIDITDGKSGA